MSVPLINTPETRSLIRGLNKMLRGDSMTKKLSAIQRAIKDGKIPETVEEAEGLADVRYELAELQKRAQYWAEVLAKARDGLQRQKKGGDGLVQRLRSGV